MNEDRVKIVWSRRTQWDLEETSWAKRLSAMRRAGARLWDLTASNPTDCGFAYDESSILGALNDRGALEYEPNPRGMLRARQAVCRYYLDHGLTVDPERIFLTTGTSEAYGFLFRLLCDAGDEVLLPQPGYPLLDFLAQLEDVRLTPYQLLYDHGWHLDPEGIRRRIGPRTKAIVVVHPNNPTGYLTSAGERSVLEELCREHGLALIVDEVFLDYSLGHPGRSFGAGDHDALTFVLSGLSKIAALPQMKVAWIAIFGVGPESVEAEQRLEVIADSFLSLNGPIQCALPSWLSGRRNLQEQIRHRLERNLIALDAALASCPLVTRLAVQAGWYAVLRVPALQPDEKLALDLLTEENVAVHAGYFFGFPEAGWLVISLLCPEMDFRGGVAGIVGYFERYGRNQDSK